MTKEELQKKDLALLSASIEMKSISYLRTILDNQAVIIAELKKIPLKEVAKQMKKYEGENYSDIVKKVKENIPDFTSFESRELEYFGM